MFLYSTVSTLKPGRKAPGNKQSTIKTATSRFLRFQWIKNKHFLLNIYIYIDEIILNIKFNSSHIPTADVTNQKQQSKGRIIFHTEQDLSPPSWSMCAMITIENTTVPLPWLWNRNSSILACNCIAGSILNSSQLFSTKPWTAILIIQNQHFRPHQSWGWSSQPLPISTCTRW